MLIGHAAEVPTDHFVGSQSWLATSPQTDQHACNDGAIHLKLNAVLRMTQQMMATQQVLGRWKRAVEKGTQLIKMTYRLCDCMSSIRYVQEAGPERIRPTLAWTTNGTTNGLRPNRVRHGICATENT